MINPGMLMKLGQAKDTFVQNHPKFPMFLKAVNEQAVKPDSVIEISVTTPEGKTLNSNIKLKESDIELIKELCNMSV